jgi:formylglycine-generating enzyme
MKRPFTFACFVLLAASSLLPLGAESRQPDFVQVPGGSFALFEPNAGPPPMYQSISPFRISRYEVTQGQFQEVMGYNPSRFKDLGDSSSRPVESVSWYEAVIFCNKLSMREGLAPVYSINGSADPKDWGAPPKPEADSLWAFVSADWGADGYRLPTEMEWRWAARGAKSAVPKEIADAPADFGWYDANAKNQGETAKDYGTHPVGAKKANALGIYDMFGNVWEWCWDWAPLTGYRMGDQADYRGQETGRYRTLRGGSWWFGPDGFGSPNANSPTFSIWDSGFRLARKAAASIGPKAAAPSGGKAAASAGDPRADLIGTWKCSWNEGKSYVEFTFSADGRFLERHRNLRMADKDTYDEFGGSWTVEGSIVTSRILKQRSNRDGAELGADDPWMESAALFSGTWCIIAGKLYWGDLAGKRIGSGTGYQGTFESFDTWWDVDRRYWTRRLMIVGESDIKVEYYTSGSKNGPWKDKPDRVVTAKFTPPENGYAKILETSDPNAIYSGAVPVAWNSAFLAFKRPAYTKQEGPSPLADPRPVFDFNSGFSGWRPVNQIEGAAVIDGAFVAKNTGNDPFMIWKGSGFDGAAWPTIVARVRSTSGNGIALYWTSAVSPNFAEDKAIHLPLVADGQYHEYRFDLSSHKLWMGQRVLDLRLDPVEGGSGGDFAVDSIIGQ